MGGWPVAVVAVTLLLHGTVAAGVEAGEPVPSCPSLTALTPGPVDPAALQGKVVLVDFWASWCPPCRRAVPFLNSLHQRHGETGLVVLGIGVDEDPAAARRFLEAMEPAYTIALDGSGDCPGRFALEAMPSTYLVDRGGRVRLAHAGYRHADREPLEAAVLRLLAE